ncbi:PREDICTED: olfactory receptor 10A3-like [Cyprinodon variegatus]|uniref:olfactory receptor 10A3-like n=2 Tax=Cyprinodon TaxID=28741 RepID=UPI0007429671|nr:PREDICTED: olfactory receptor 10A3-like [Cyprinodon variegatus]
MTNFTHFSFFTLDAYFDIKQLRYILFMFVLFLYVLIIGSNVLLIVLICVNRSLHEPMYMFVCSLFLNQLYGSSSLFPFLLGHMLSDTHTVAVPLCFMQIFCLYTYVGVEFCNLAVMSYDRYLAICHPLQYQSLMTMKKVAVLIAVAWITAFLIVVITTSLSFSLQLCGNVINKIYCDNYSIVKLACSDTTVNNIYGLISTALIVFVPFGIVLYTYLRILKVCFSGSKQTRQKAISTCTPHLASLINFSFGVCFEVLQSRFNMSSVPHAVKIFLSLYYITCQPLFNPVMYGLKLSKIRSSWQRLFR